MYLVWDIEERKEAVSWDVQLDAFREARKASIPAGEDGEEPEHSVDLMLDKKDEGTYENLFKVQEQSDGNLETQKSGGQSNPWAAALTVSICAIDLIDISDLRNHFLLLPQSRA